MMKCQGVAEKLSEYVDQFLPEGQSEEMSAHFESCRDCHRMLVEMREMRGALLQATPRRVPDGLQMSLLVLASRERSRTLTRITWSSRFQEYRSRVQLFVNNLMRPLAIPFAGGFCSALLLFCMLVPNFSPRYKAGADVPLGLYTGASLKSTVFGFSGDVVTLDVDIDDQGRMIDYTVTSGHHWMDNPALRRNIENTLLFVRFKPATGFGQPMSGRVQISFQPASYIDVKG
ncbi:MAG: hypothetical protein ABI693_27955 [Bryobacteraceae bacterium]